MGRGRDGDIKMVKTEYDALNRRIWNINRDFVERTVREATNVQTERDTGIPATKFSSGSCHVNFAAISIVVR